MAVPQLGDYAPFYEPYLVQTAAAKNITALVELFSNGLTQRVLSIPAHKAGFAYQPNKWTVSEVLQHMIDAERIFAYRLLRIARHDTTALPGFDEVAFAQQSQANSRSFESLQKEWVAVRTSTDCLLASLPEESLQQRTVVNGTSTTANALAYILYGHALHHLAVLEQRYSL